MQRSGLIVLTCAAIGCFTHASTAFEMPRVAVQPIQATPAVVDRAGADGASVENVLRQIMEGAEADLEQAIMRTGMFEVTSGTDLQAVLDAQDLQNSGLYDESDPRRARAFSLAGFDHVATVTINNFQLIDRTDVIPDAFGDSTYILETIQLGAVLQVHDVTRGTLIASVDVVSEHDQETRIIDSARQTGAYSSAMIGATSRDFAQDAATALLDVVAPPRVIEFQDGTIWLNRGAGTGISVGDVYCVRDPGRVLRDPTTGATLGSSESLNGWAVVTDVHPRYAVAEAVELARAPAVGHSSMRPADALPPSLHTAMRDTGPFEAPVRVSPAVGAAVDTLVDPADPDAAARARGPASSLTLALFVDSVAELIPPDRVSTLERQLHAMLAAEGVRVISRRDVLDAVASLKTGAGSPRTPTAQELLSDRTSVTTLARTLGAQGILTASITSGMLDTTVSAQTQRVVAKATIDVAWSLLEGGSGVTADGGLVSASERFIASDERIRLEVNTVDRLLRGAAEDIAANVRISLASELGREFQLDAPRRAIEIVARIQNMTVPEIRRVDGIWTISGDQYPLTAEDCMISIDGVLVGSTPGPVSMPEGSVRLQLEHPLCEAIDRYVRIDDTTGALRIPIVLSAQGRAEFERRTDFFESLKDGAAVRDNEQALIEGVVDFLRRSSITVDTSQVRNLSVGQPSIWVEELD